VHSQLLGSYPYLKLKVTDLSITMVNTSQIGR
jgi:hypothetical protein